MKSNSRSILTFFELVPTAMMSKLCIVVNFHMFTYSLSELRQNQKSAFDYMKNNMCILNGLQSNLSTAIDIYDTSNRFISFNINIFKT